MQPKKRAETSDMFQSRPDYLPDPGCPFYRMVDQIDRSISEMAKYIVYM